MLSATSRGNAVLHRAAWSNVSGGTKRVLVRPGTEALAITAMPQAETEGLSLPRTALRMTTPMPRDTPGGARVLGGYKERFGAAWAASPAQAKAAAAGAA